MDEFSMFYFNTIYMLNKLFVCLCKSNRLMCCFTEQKVGNFNDL